MDTKLFSGVAVLLLIAFAANQFAQVDGINCWAYEGPFIPNNTQSPVMPPEAHVEPCGEGSMCIKLRLQMHIYDPVEGPTDSVRYLWSCYNFGPIPIPMDLKCGESFEWGSGGYVDRTVDTTAQSNAQYNHWRGCACCGDTCNNETDCSEEPKFDKKCLSAGFWEPTPVTSPVLPDYAMEIDCTAKQACMKTSNVDAQGKVSYSWGCANPRGGQGCFSSTYVVNTDNSTNKMCTCCGNDCNHHYMDAIVATDQSCGAEESTTTTPAAPTTAVPITTVAPPCNADCSAVGGVLGTFFAVTFVALLGALYYIYRLRQFLERSGHKLIADDPPNAN